MFHLRVFVSPKRNRWSRWKCKKIKIIPILWFVSLNVIVRLDWWIVRAKISRLSLHIHCQLITYSCIGVLKSFSVPSWWLIKHQSEFLLLLLCMEWIWVLGEFIWNKIISIMLENIKNDDSGVIIPASPQEFNRNQIQIVKSSIRVPFN